MRSLPLGGRYASMSKPELNNTHLVSYMAKLHTFIILLGHNNEKQLFILTAMSVVSGYQTTIQPSHYTVLDPEVNFIFIHQW